MLGGRLTSIQYLRGAAALGVIGCHSQAVLKYVVPGPHTYSVAGAYGVDVFFVISGFILYVTHRRDFGQPGASAYFLWRRFIRIVPLYWLATTAMFFLLAIAPMGSVNTTWGLTDLPNSYLFLNMMLPVIVTGWSLSFEGYFYLLFALLMMGRARWLLPCLTLIFGAGIAVHLSSSAMPFWGETFTNPLLLELLSGCIIGELFIRRRLPRLSVAVGGIIVGIAVLTIASLEGVSPPFWSTARTLSWGLPSAMIVMGLVAVEVAGRLPQLPFLGRTGDASYSIYLSHVFTIPVVGKLWHAAHIHMASSIAYPAAYSVAFFLSLGIGMITYRFVEKPMLRRFSQSAAVAQGAPA